MVLGMAALTLTGCGVPSGVVLPSATRKPMLSLGTAVAALNVMVIIAARVLSVVSAAPLPGSKKFAFNCNSRVAPLVSLIGIFNGCPTLFENSVVLTKLGV